MRTSQAFQKLTFFTENVFNSCKHNLHLYPTFTYDLELSCLKAKLLTSSPAPDSFDFVNQ